MKKETSSSGTVPDSAQILDRMRRLCSMREYCTSDIKAKVEKMLRSRSGSAPAAMVPSGDGGAADAIIASLQAEGYLSDLRYATAFARDKASLSGWGMTKIRFALSSKGIDSETVALAMEEIDKGRAAERLDKVLLTKYNSLRSRQESWDQVRQKLIRFALSRGYRLDEISSAIDRLPKH